MSRFGCGDRVVVREDHPLIDLKAGDCGIIIIVYDTNPAAYEVSFRGQKGVEFDTVMEEGELDSGSEGHHAHADLAF